MHLALTTTAPAARVSRSRKAAAIRPLTPLRAFNPEGMIAPLPTTPEMVQRFSFDNRDWAVEVVSWNARQWASLATKPSDARPNPDGSWVALRVV